jgi:hypothetical protein
MTKLDSLHGSGTDCSLVFQLPSRSKAKYRDEDETTTCTRLLCLFGEFLAQYQGRDVAILQRASQQLKDTALFLPQYSCAILAVPSFLPSPHAAQILLTGLNRCVGKRIRLPSDSHACMIQVVVSSRGS